jgi:glycosyltransferase involved in cell wall biosynthesis
MKIVITSQNHVSRYVGGNEIYTHSLASQLAKNGHAVTYLTSNADSNFSSSYALTVVSGKQYGKYVIPPFKWFSSVDKVKPDIVHATGSGVGITALGIYCRLKKIRTLLTFQAPQRGSLLGKIDEWFQLHFFDTLIATSPSNKTYLSKRTPAPVEMVLLCLKPEFTCDKRLGKIASRKRLGLRDDVTYILMTAKLDDHHYYKGVETALHALAKLPNKYQLLIVGDGPLLPYYQQMVRSLRLKNRATFLGYIPDTLQPLYYLAADVFILPSTSESEGFGLVSLEAMACKTPVIITDCVGIAAYFKKHKLARIIRPKNAVDLARAIISPLVSVGQVKAAHNFAVSQTVDVMTKETEMVYEK